MDKTKSDQAGGNHVKTFPTKMGAEYSHIALTPRGTPPRSANQRSHLTHSFDYLPNVETHTHN